MERLLIAIPLCALILGILPWRGRGEDKQETPQNGSAEGGLEKTEERFGSLVRHSSDIIMVIDLEGIVRYTSPSVRDVLGYEPEERLGLKGEELIHPDDRERVARAFAEMVDGADRLPALEYRVRHADGSWRYVESIAGRLPDDPDVDGFVINSRDVTERKRIEEDLRRSEERYRAVIEQSAEGIYLLDTETLRVTETNPSLRRMLGYDADEMAGRPLYDLLAHPREDVDENLRLTLQERSRFVGERKYRRKDGSVLDVEVGVSTISYGGKDVVCAVVRDITGRKRAEAALRESEERHRRQARDLELLDKVRTAVSRELELPAVFRAVVEAIAEAYGYTLVSAYLREEELTLQHQVGYGQVIERVPVGSGVMGRVARTGQPVLLEDVRQDPAFLGAIEGITSEVCVPLLDEGRVMGVLNVESTEGMALTEDDLRLMNALADHVGMAIGRSRLYTRVLQSEERFRSLVRNATDVILIMEADGAVRYASPALEQILGYKPEEVVGRSNFEVVHPDDATVVDSAVAEAVSNPGTTRFMELRLRHADGSWRHVESSCISLLDDPAVNGIVFNTHDVTKRKRAEVRVREAEGKYRTLVEQIPAITYVEELRENGKVLTYMSPQYETMLGYSPDEGMSHPDQWLDLVHPEDREQLAEKDARTDETLEPFEAEYRMIARDGRTVWIRDEAVAVHDEAGKPLFWQGVMFDITEQKRIEEALHSSEARLLTVIEQSPLGIHIFAPDGTSMLANEAWDDLWALGEDERPEGTNIFEDEQLRETGLTEYIERVVSQGAELVTPPLVFDPAAIGRAGSPRWLRAMIYPVKDEDGRMLENVLLLEDVTERKKAEEALRASEARFRRAFEDAPIGVALVDPENRYLRVNRALCEILGYEERELLGQRSFEITHPEDAAKSRARSRRLLLGYGLDTQGLEKRYIRKDGSVAWVLSVVSLLRDSEGRSSHFVCHYQDITERRRAEEELKEAEERYRTLVEQIPAAIYTQKPAFTTAIEYISPQIEDITGYPPEGYVRDPYLWVKNLHPEDRDRVMASDERAERTGEPFREEFRTITRDGRVIWIRDEANLIRDEEGRPRVWQGIFTDITERKTLEQRLEQLAYLDVLTHLPNRASLTARTAQALDRAGPNEGFPALLALDLDNFRVVNDSLGYDAGDVLLIAAAERLRACLGPKDVVARLGEDEFAILLEGVRDTDHATAVAERIEENLRAPFPLGMDQEATVTASIGVALATPDHERPEDLLREADAAMLRAKDEGKAGYRVFDPSMDTKALQRLEMARELRLAVGRREMVVRYEPNVLLDADGVVGMKALVCWAHPERGLLPPSEFLGVAEDTPLIHEIGRGLLREACRQAREWQERFPSDVPPMVSVGLTGKQFRQKNLVEEVATLLRDAGLVPRSLNISITEDAAMQDVAFTVTRLGALKDLGVQLTVEGFGAGYSSLGHLSRFPVDFLEIDSSFVKNLREASADAAIVSGTVSLAHALGLTAAAEGAETARQVSQLRMMGCNLVRGPYFSSLLTSEAATELLETRGFPWSIGSG